MSAPPTPADLAALLDEARALLLELDDYRDLGPGYSDYLVKLCVRIRAALDAAHKGSQTENVAARCDASPECLCDPPTWPDGKPRAYHPNLKCLLRQCECGECDGHAPRTPPRETSERGHITRFYTDPEYRAAREAEARTPPAAPEYVRPCECLTGAEWGEHAPDCPARQLQQDRDTKPRKG